MRRRTLFWMVLPYYLAIILVSMALAAFYASSQMRAFHLDEITRELEARARVVGESLDLTPTPAALKTVDSVVRRLAELTDTRITVINSSGVVLGDSDEDPGEMENHGARPEIAQALSGKVGVATRFSNTLQRTMLYVAVGVQNTSGEIVIVRTSRPMTAIDSAMSSFYLRLFVGGLAVAVLAGLAGVFALRRFTRPLVHLRVGAERIASGDFGVRMSSLEIEEIAALADSMNLMAAQLDARIQTITSERNVRDAILAGMSEGVVALDAEDRVVWLNRSAAGLLNLSGDGVVGQSIFGLVRIAALHDLIERATVESEVTESEFAVGGSEGRHLLAHASALRDGEGRRVGLVVVLGDITRLKQLENMRRDFVANVSHELKTPITAIRGSTETLLSGAAQDPGNATRFLDMIDRQSARLNNLVDDLLSLARIEEQARIQPRTVALYDVLKAAVTACREQASLKNISLEIDCAPALTANIDQSQMEQALVNLISNAIQYSDEGMTVRVSAENVGDEVRFSVIDQGCGIEARHLTRIFERFYRVDTARSRASGGTGLGLAIVKHIVIAHGGRVEVDSTPALGSTFRIHIPKQSK